MCIVLLIAHQNCSPEPQVRFGIWEECWQEGPCQVLPDTLIWVSPRSILALLLLSSSTWSLIKVTVESLYRQLGLLPRPGVCPVLAGVTREWLGLEVCLLSRNYFFETPGFKDLARVYNLASGNCSQTGIE